MVKNAIHGFLGQIKALATLFQILYHSEALLVVGKVTCKTVKDCFPGVSKGCMSHIMPQCNGLCKIFVKSQASGNGAAYL